MRTVEFDERVVSEVNADDAEFESDVKLGAALAFYLKHRLTLGQAAQMGGMSQYEFSRFLNEHGVAAIAYPVADLDREARV